MAPAVQLPASTSFRDSWSGEATERLAVKNTEVWRIHSDTAKSVVSEKITGNRPLSTTRWNYHVVMRQVVDWYQRMRRGGLTCRNWLRLECAAGNWDAAVEAARSNEADAVAVFRPVSEPVGEQRGNDPEEEKNTRCGAQTAPWPGAVEMTTRSRTTQEQYGAKILYAKTMRVIAILMKSLSEGARAGYRGSWKHWVNFCRWQGQPVWLDSREESWDGNLVNSILSEREVLGLKSAAIR